VRLGLTTNAAHFQNRSPEYSGNVEGCFAQISPGHFFARSCL
jgi:hypothetical protein